MKQCHGQQVCSQAVGYSLLAPKHFEVYHQKYEETTEEALQTSCTWNTYANIEAQRETHKSTTFYLSLSTIFSSKMGNKITGFMKKKKKTQTDFAMRESFTTIALLKITFRSTGSRMWSGDSFCLRAIFQSPSVTQRKCCAFLFIPHTQTKKQKYFCWCNKYVWSFLNTEHL